MKLSHPENRSFRFHAKHAHLVPVFGESWFALRAEAFARFFGTPLFLVGQTIIVLIWILLNSFGLTHFDLYPFILLNLAFSLQAAYAAPLILLAQTRQADRDTAHAKADAEHRESLAAENSAAQHSIAAQTDLILELMQQNTRLTETTKGLSEEIRNLSASMHRKLQCDLQ
ncbi:MAG: DUF1003 domain-containing protein [Cryobacterium sp.]|nr:DUF1003 domain-containing protein [Oligoflexia bacterium]